VKSCTPTVPDKAAALTHSLVLNHAFHDANKRTGILAGCVFMEVNGCELVAARSALLDVALEVENKSRDMAGLAEWFGDPANVLPLKEEEWIELERLDLERRFTSME
jgi:death-on-curing family protein